MTLASGLDAGASAGAHALARYRSEFPIFRDAVYLNTCSLGALGERTRRRIAEFFDLWQARGASAWYDVWWAALSELRARSSERAAHHTSYQADAPRACHRSKNSAMRRRVRSPSAPSEQVFKYTACRKIGNSLR